MTKNELVHTIRGRLKAGGKTDDTQFHPQLIENVIAKYRSALLKRLRENELDSYAKEYTEAVQTNGTTNRKYVDLPVQIEDLPRVAKGVVSVSTATGYDFRLYPTTEREMKLTDGLECNKVSTSKFGYIVRFDRIDFDPLFSGITTVRMMLIPTLDEYASTDEVPLGDLEKDVIEGATNYLLGTPPPDLKNN